MVPQTGASLVATLLLEDFTVVSHTTESMLFRIQPSPLSGWVQRIIRTTRGSTAYPAGMIEKLARMDMEPTIVRHYLREQLLVLKGTKHLKVPRLYFIALAQEEPLDHRGGGLGLRKTQG